VLCGFRLLLRFPHRFSACFQLLEGGGRMKRAVMITQAGKSEADGIVRVDRDFGAGGSRGRFFAKARPVDLLSPKRAGLHLIERAIQVRHRVRFRRIVAGGLGRDGQGSKECRDYPETRRTHVSQPRVSLAVRPRKSVHSPPELRDRGLDPRWPAATACAPQARDKPRRRG